MSQKTIFTLELPDAFWGTPYASYDYGSEGSPGVVGRRQRRRQLDSHSARLSTLRASLVETLPNVEPEDLTLTLNGTWIYIGTAVTVEVTANSDRLNDKDVLRQSNLIASSVTDTGFTATLADSLCLRIGCEASEVEIMEIVLTNRPFLVVVLPPEILPAPSPPPPRAPPPRPPPSPLPPPQVLPSPPPQLCRPIYGRGDCSPPAVTPRLKPRSERQIGGRGKGCGAVWFRSPG